MHPFLWGLWEHQENTRHTFIKRLQHNYWFQDYLSIAKAFGMVTSRTATKPNLAAPLEEEEVRPHPLQNPFTKS